MSEFGYDVHIVADGAELSMTVNTPAEEAFLEEFIGVYGVPKVSTRVAE